MFTARQQFNYQPASGTSWGNNMLFPASAGQFVSKSSTTDLINWKATTGYTIEYWGYWTAFSSSINGGPGNQDGAGTNYSSFGPITSGQLEFYFWSGATNFVTTGTGVVGLNTWTNISAVFTSVGSNTTISLYVNGVRQVIRLGGSGAYTDTVTVATGIISTGTVFGMGRYGSNFITGYLNSLRVSNIDRYSGASYTLATSPFTSDANTQILIQPTDAPGTTISYTGVSSGTMTNASNLVTVTATRANHT